MVPRGLTLIEMLIALALLAAILALVTPPLAERFAERSFEAAQAEVQAHLLLARAEAMSSGTPREVRYLPDPGRLVIVPFDPHDRTFAQDESDMLGGGHAARDGSDEAGGGRQDSASEFAFEAGSEDAAARSWSRLDLPTGVAFRTEPPGERTGLDARFEVEPEPLELRPLRLAVFLSDGSVLASRDVWLADAHDRAGRLVVNPWTGQTRFERHIAPIDTDDEFLLADTGDASQAPNAGSRGGSSP